MASLRRLLAVASLGLVLAACGRGPGEGAADAQPEVEEPTELKVINNNWSEITIFVVQSGGRTIRLGMVTGLSRQTFRVPDDLVGMGRTINLLADPIGAVEPFLSERIQVFPGDLIEWRLENNLQHSALSIF